MVHLITQFYKVNYENADKDLIRKRQDEITYCFKTNLNNPHVEKIHFLYEKEEDVDFLEEEGIKRDNEKIVLYNLGSRMKYNLIFEYANKHLDGEICVYLHSDMVINSGFDLLDHENTRNNVFPITSHKPNCNGQFICRCTRQFKTNRGWMGVTFDGFAFKSPIKEEAVKELDHIVHRLGAENRTICILKEHGYNVVCPNQILRCTHLHNVKIFAKQHASWVNREGEVKPQDYYSKIHAQQAGLPYEKIIVAGGLPFFMGSCEFVDRL